uniref:Uncharacterized protein n=1 Tax=viral metagenome TaxID=1070528 RepID=A0A6M3X522_9ZZZZ
MSKAKPVLRMVTAPNKWKCQCGKVIQAGESCGKMGKLVFCMECLKKESKRHGDSTR